MYDIDKNWLDDVREAMLNDAKNCYKDICENIILLESNTVTSPDFLYKKINRIDKDIVFLKILFDVLCCSKQDQKQFQSMRKYYKQTRKSTWDTIYKLFNEQKSSIHFCLQDIFVQIWKKLELIDSGANVYDDFQELDILFCLVVDELKEWLRSKELSKSEYNLWMNKLNSAKNYVKKIYI